MIPGDDSDGIGAPSSPGREQPAAPGSTGGWDFFVSYTGADRSWAEWIAWQLEAAGYAVLVQAWDFVPGSHWTVQMHEGVRRARRMLAVLSETYLTSVYGQAEWEAAFRSDPNGLARRLIPVRITDCDRPDPFDGIVGFDLFGLTAGEAKRRLLEQVRIAREGRAKPAAEPAFPGGLDRELGSIRAPDDRAPRNPPEFPGAHPPPTEGARGADAPPVRPPTGEHDLATAPRHTARARVVAIPEVDTDPDYTEALDALFTERWADALTMFEQLEARFPREPRVTDRLAYVRIQHELATWASRADDAHTRGDWAEVVEALEQVSALDPNYQGCGTRLEHARLRRRIAHLVADLRSLHAARRWDAVVKAGRQLAALDPTLADPDGLVASARAALAEAEREASLAGRYATALRHLEQEEWKEAVRVLTGIRKERPDYRNVTALLARAIAGSNEGTKKTQRPDQPTPRPWVDMVLCAVVILAGLLLLIFGP